MSSSSPSNPHDFARTLVGRLSASGGVVDRAREMATRLGARPFRVYLVWTVFSGESRGKGDEKVLERHEIEPRPRVDKGSITRNPSLVGIVAQGSVRVDELPVRFTFDELEGSKLPGGRALPTDQGRVSFFYEVVEDGRGDHPAERLRFRLFNKPSLEAENAQWSLILEPVSEGMQRNGQPERPGRF